MAGNGFSIMGSSLKLVQAYTPTRENGSVPPGTAVGSAWFNHSDSTATGVRAIYGVDGGSQHADTVSVFRAEIETGNLMGKVVGIVSGNTIKLDQEVHKDAVKPGDIIALSNVSSLDPSQSTAVILEVDSSYPTGPYTDPKLDEFPINLNGRFTHSSLSFSFPFAGSYMYNLRDITFVTYYIDEAQNTLMADYHDKTRNGYDDLTRNSFVVANNIEDLQLFYYYGVDTVDITQVNTAPDISSGKLDAESVKAVAMGMTARSPYGDGPYNQARPALFNRAAGTARDNRMRSTLVQTIQLRNFQPES
jgi:hypothetical protein